MLCHALKKLQKISVGIADAFTKELRYLLQIGVGNLPICNFHSCETLILFVARTFSFPVTRSFRVSRGPVVKATSAR